MAYNEIFLAMKLHLCTLHQSSSVSVKKDKMWQEPMLRMLLCTNRKTLLQATKMVFSAKNMSVQ